MNDALKAKLATLPLKPGCYQMKDKDGQIIYVGKAKKLKNRVNQYFVGTHNLKTTLLVKDIADFEYIVTNSEKEALLLEFNLIKKYRPMYNIALMDGSSYPYIRLTLEDYPTLKVVRDARKMKKARYFGPYPVAGSARQIVDLLNKMYPLRKCLNMPKKVCLYYHLGQCLGPCEYPIEPKVYNDLVSHIVRFIKGDTASMMKEAIEKRDAASAQLQFEQAARYQELIEAISHVTASQEIIYEKSKDVDVFDYYVDKGYISIVGLLIRSGRLIHRHLVLQPLYGDAEDVFTSFLMQYYQKNVLPDLLLLPPSDGIDATGLQESLQVKIHQPQRGTVRKLLMMASENAKINLDQKFEVIDKRQQGLTEALDQLEQITHTKPGRIELYDNSHTAGQQAVGAMVVYYDGQPSKKDYRLYKVHNGGDDFANMQEVLYRRLQKSVMENTVLPDIIIVDGGAPQIRAAAAVKNELQLSFKLLGLAKDDKHQTNTLLDEDLQAVNLKRDSPLFFLLTRMQDEVHRFAISFHKKLRLKNMAHSLLDDIPGLGPVGQKKLLNHFGSARRLLLAEVAEIGTVIGPKEAEVVYGFIHENEKLELNSQDCYTETQGQKNENSTDE